MNQNRSAIVDASDPRGDSALDVRLPSTSAAYPSLREVNPANENCPWFGPGIRATAVARRGDPARLRELFATTLQPAPIDELLG
jgi:hypothetical protein